MFITYLIDSVIRFSFTNFIIKSAFYFVKYPKNRPL